MSIPITLLKNLETISSLKVLVYLYDKSNNNGVIRISMNQLVDDSGIARNSAKRGLQELLDKNIVVQIATGKGNHPNTYKVSKVDSPKVDPSPNIETEVEGWKKATGSKREEDCDPTDGQLDNNINNIVYKDFKEYNFYNTDINSLSVPNDNHKLNDEQLGKLARRVLVEWFLPLANLKTKQPPYFFPQQMKLIKDLLVEYRTEQVLASIQYWTKINPPKNGMKSLRWLQFERKGTSHILIALDHYKQNYVDKQDEHEQEERKKKVEEMKAKAIEIAKENVAKKTKIDETSDDDFVKDLLGGLGRLNF